MGHKAAEITHNINHSFGPGTVNEHTVQWWLKKFCKGDQRLEDEECSGQQSEADNDQLRALSKLILLQLHEKLPKNSLLTILCSFGLWSKLGKWKSLISGCLMSRLQILKKSSFEVSSSLILWNNNEPFQDPIVTCKEKWIVYNNQWQPPQWLVQENAPKYFPKPNFHQKTVTVSLVVCCLSDPRQLSESWGNHYIWEVHSVNQWDTLKIPTPAALSHWQFCSVYFSICV